MSKNGNRDQSQSDGKSGGTPIPEVAAGGGAEDLVTAGHGAEDLVGVTITGQDGRLTFFRQTRFIDFDYADALQRSLLYKFNNDRRDFEPINTQEAIRMLRAETAQLRYAIGELMGRLEDQESPPPGDLAVPDVAEFYHLQLQEDERTHGAGRKFAPRAPQDDAAKT